MVDDSGTVASTKKTQPIVLAIHGGAGTIRRGSMTPEREAEYRHALAEALNTGYAVLKRGGTALDAVSAAVVVLEDSPLFNAGRGAVLTADGTVELDAAIMDGKTLKAGAVASVRGIKNPVLLARKVMEHTPHVMLVGLGAQRFAREQGVQIVHDKYFITKSQRRELERMQRDNKPSDNKPNSKQSMDEFPRPSSRGQVQPDTVQIGKTRAYYRKIRSGMLRSVYIEERQHNQKFGTVGAVALDMFGNLAAATSTGGMANKRYGRVGDAPIIGAGTYANNATCAVSATGHGEYFIRNVVAHDIAALVEYKGLPLQRAASEVVMRKLVECGGVGGVIAVDALGTIAMPFNSEGMYRGYINADGQMYVGIYRDGE
ncbi:MAG: isoaspartyl peptidase/L-asparaginase [Bacteroidota bacterium]|nr:isoaspartyl peptidase/L-asparaginase [Candidatus Kapabacteria bacterium]MDW8219356.1 isoaspartyl peptidase/L-asparaginase [Bacteroidota bacterium]